MTSLSRTRAMQLFTLGLNHHTAPLAIREKVAFATEALSRAVGELRSRVLKCVSRGAKGWKICC